MAAPAINTRRVGIWTVLTVDGELDLYAAPRLRAELIDLMADGHHRVIVDMDAVTFIDSNGLGVLIGALKRLRLANGDLRVAVSTDPVLRTMRVTGLHRVFGPYGSVDDAVASRTTNATLSPA
jgi:anti-sigma B factor antagonist